MKPKVGVVILTLNRLNLLRITLCKVLSQTHAPAEVLVVDNNSADGTREYLEGESRVSTLFLKENEGPAGGFHEGIKYFAEKTEVDYVWLMDDDFFPFPDCLEILLENTNPGTVAYPHIREKDFASRRMPGWWGVLIPMPVIKQVGYPMKELFFWSEDTEYMQERIRDRHKIPCVWIPRAKGVHFTKRSTNYRQAWRYYYEVRNMLYMRLYVKKKTPLRAYKLVRSWVKLFGKIIITENDKREKIEWFLRGTVHGVSKKIGKTIEPHGGKDKNSTHYKVTR